MLHDVSCHNRLSGSQITGAPEHARITPSEPLQELIRSSEPLACRAVALCSNFSISDLVIEGGKLFELLLCQSIGFSLLPLFTMNDSFELVFVCFLSLCALILSLGSTQLSFDQADCFVDFVAGSIDQSDYRSEFRVERPSHSFEQLYVSYVRTSTQSSSCHTRPAQRL
jgi:hypothetical protein